MIKLSEDKKSNCFIITKTDSEGFHHQLTCTLAELLDLCCAIGRFWRSSDKYKSLQRWPYIKLIHETDNNKQQ